MNPVDVKLFKEISAIQETPEGRETDEDADDEEETDDEKQKVPTIYVFKQNNLEKLNFNYHNF